MILGIYQITYSHGVVQRKNLIKHEDYLEHKKEVDLLMLDQKKGDKAISSLTKAFKKVVGDEYFTTQSPLGMALITGVLILPENQGGVSKCNIIKIS